MFEHLFESGPFERMFEFYFAAALSRRPVITNAVKSNGIFLYRCALTRPSDYDWEQVDEILAAHS